MHVGNLRTALYAYLTARHENGSFILRIEDTDQGRLVDGAVDVIYKTLRDNDMTWDEGPDVGGNYGPYVQSERMGLFKDYAIQLVDAGRRITAFARRNASKSFMKSSAPQAKRSDITIVAAAISPRKRSNADSLQGNLTSFVRKCRPRGRRRLTT